MVEITGTIIGAEVVDEKLRNLPLAVQNELRQVVKQKTMELLGRAKEKVSGEVLRNRTGTLRRKLNASFEREGLLGAVGIKLSYAAAHEFGVKAQGTCSVRAHVRRTLAEAKTRGKAAIKRGQGSIQVKAHSRNWRVDLPERSFLRAALRELGPSIRDALRAAIGKAAK
jgi:phage gpG-like protein